MSLASNCTAFLAVGVIILSPVATLAGEADTLVPFETDRIVNMGETEAASVHLLQQRAKTRQGAAANRTRPSKPKPAARSSSRNSVSHDRDRNRNRNSNRDRGNRNNRNTNISGNDVNINIDRDVRYDNNHHHHHDHWDDWDDNWHPWATAAAVTMTAAVIGSIVASIPPDCSTVIVNGISYSQCGNTWYQPQYYGSSVQYVVVNPPR